MKDMMGRTVGIHGSKESAQAQIDLFERLDRDDNYLAHEVMYTLRLSAKGSWVVTKWVERYTNPEVWSTVAKEQDNE